MPRPKLFETMSARLARVTRRAKRVRSDRASMENIDKNVGIEARDRQSASDASHGAAQNPSEQGGEG